jgi:septal ring factor EnvC (AmiA/AmiB activator)
MCVRALGFCLLFALCFSPLSWSEQSSGGTVREQTQNELLILKVRLIGLGKTIETLKNQIAILSQQLQNSEDHSALLEKQLQESKALLETQEQEYATLSTQLEDLKNSLLKSKIETGLICGGIGLVVGAGIVTIIALIK